MMALRGLILLPLLAVFLGGCQDPYRQHAERRDEPRPAVREHSRGDERPSLAREHDSAPVVDGDAKRYPRAAVDAFCTQWANWSWRTIERQQRRLAALATGRLARQLAAEARRRAQDQTLRRDRLGTRGRVVAIDIKPGTATRNAVCVAWEEQLAHGHADPEGARHRVYLTTIQHTTDGWAIRRWEPQP
jgi:hypothetical protein